MGTWTKESIEVEGKLLFCCMHGRPAGSNWVSTCPKPGGQVLLGTTYIEKCLRGILPTEPKTLIEDLAELLDWEQVLKPKIHRDYRVQHQHISKTIM